MSWRLVEAAAPLATQQGYQQLYYWVGRSKLQVPHRRLPPSLTRLRPRTAHHAPLTPSRMRRLAMVLSLEPDTTWRRTRQMGSQAPAKARYVETRAEQQPPGRE